MVCGSRSFNNYPLLRSVLNDYHRKFLINILIHGNAEGADKLAGRWARENTIMQVIHNPEWKKYGKAAGVFRNSQMVEACDKGIAFWDGKSRGTKDSIQKLKEAGKLFKIVKFTPGD